MGQDGRRGEEKERRRKERVEGGVRVGGGGVEWREDDRLGGGGEREREREREGERDKQFVECYDLIALLERLLTGEGPTASV
jgi:hypothetical protein